MSPSNPFLFFLTIALNLLCQESDLDKEDSKFVDIFPSIKDFAAFYSRLTTVLGQLVDLEDGMFFVCDARFLVLIQIPRNYPIQIDRLDPSILFKSSMMCLLFEFDIIAAIAADSDPFKWKIKGSVKKPLMQ